MYRILSASVILNWLAVLAVLGFTGFGFDDQSPGMIGMVASLLSDNGAYHLPQHLAQGTSIFLALIVLTTGIWALLAVIFADPNGGEKGDQEFVVTLAFGSCLFIFTVLLGYAFYLEEGSLGALVSVASFATIIAGIANRVFSVESVEHFETNPFGTDSVSKNHAKSMAAQSARLASFNAGPTRFVPKPRFQSPSRHS